MRMHHILFDTHHLSAFSQFLRKMMIIAILNMIWIFNTVPGVEMDASVTFQAQTVVSGGIEDFLRSHSKQFISLSIMYAVCMNYVP